MPTIRIPGALRPLTAGASDVDVAASTVRSALSELERKHPGVSAKLLDATGGVKPFIKIFVGSEDISALSGLDTPVAESDEIAIIPAIAGG